MVNSTPVEAWVGSLGKPGAASSSTPIARAHTHMNFFMIFLRTVSTYLDIETTEKHSHVSASNVFRLKLHLYQVYIQHTLSSPHDE